MKYSATHIIITAAVCSLAVLLLIIIIVAAQPKKSYQKDTIEIDTSTILFTTLDDSICFSYSDIPELKKIFELADVLALNNELMINDSSSIKTIGSINDYKFKYHYVYANPPIHYILVNGNNKEIFIPKYNKFIDNLCHN